MSDYITLPNRAVAYTTKGKGNPIVLLHGYAEDSRIWNKLASPLSEFYRVVRIDFAGYGEAPPSDNMAMEQLAADILAVLDSENINRALLVGHSMGGYAALAFAEQFAQRLQGLVLLHSTAHADSEERRENRQKNIAIMQQRGTKQTLDLFFESLFTPEYRQDNAGRVANFRKNANAYTASTLIASHQAMIKRPDRQAVLAQLSCPVGFIMGKHDKFVPYQQNISECLLPQRVKACLLSHAGHAAMLEATDITLAFIADFADFCYDSNIQ